MVGYRFDWGVLWTPPYRDWLAAGLIHTLAIGVASWGLALLLGLLVGLLRSVHSRALRTVGTLYVEVFRNIPLLVQLFLWYYAVPPLLGPRFLRMPDLNLYVAVIGLGTYTASRVAEHVRSGLNGVGLGQHWAGLSTGLTHLQLYRYVILPQAVRLVIPPLTAEFLTTFKNTSVLLVIGVLEVTGAAQRIGSLTFRGIEALTAAMAAYLAIGLTVVGLMSLIERRARIPGLYGRA